jgi:hypothetical protein
MHCEAQLDISDIVLACRYEGKTVLMNSKECCGHGMTAPVTIDQIVAE